MQNLLKKLFGKPSKKADNKDHVKEAVLKSVTLNKVQKQSAIKFLELSSETVEDIIVPRSDIKGVQQTADFATTMQAFALAQSMQMLVYENSLDKITGCVYFSDVVQYMSNPQEFSIEKVRKDVQFIVPNMNVIDAIQQMQTTGTRILVVVDEFGGVDGMVCVDKIIYEIFGEFCDGSGCPSFILPTSVPGEFIIDAKAPIDLVEEKLNVKLLMSMDDDGGMPDIETIGGLVTTIFGKVPSIGEVVDHPSGVKFMVKEANLRRVMKILVKTDDSTNTGK